MKVLFLIFSIRMELNTQFIFKKPLSHLVKELEMALEAIMVMEVVVMVA